MSAECHTCGSDLVYPEGTWPLGECPVCTRVKEADELRARVEQLEEELAKKEESVEWLRAVMKAEEEMADQRFTDLVAARTTLEELARWASAMPDAGFSSDSPRWDWWHEGARIRERAREILAAPPGGVPGLQSPQDRRREPENG